DSVLEGHDSHPPPSALVGGSDPRAVIGRQTNSRARLESDPRLVKGSPGNLVATGDRLQRLLIECVSSTSLSGYRQSHAEQLDEHLVGEPSRECLRWERLRVRTEDLL